MTFESQGKFLTGVAGDFVVHMESPQKCLNKLAAVTGASGATSLKGPVLVADDATVIAAGGVFTGANQFIIAGPAVAESGTTGSAVDPYTIIDDFDGCVLNSAVLSRAGYTSTDITAIKAAAAFANVKWVTEPVKSTEQAGGTKAT